MTETTAERLEYLRGEIRAQRISYGELAELQGLAEHIDPSDVELLEWAGVPEYECPQCGGTGQRATARTANGRDLARHERHGTKCDRCNGTGHA